MSGELFKNVRRIRNKLKREDDKHTLIRYPKKPYLENITQLFYLDLITCLILNTRYTSVSIHIYIFPDFCGFVRLGDSVCGLPAALWNCTACCQRYERGVYFYTLNTSHPREFLCCMMVSSILGRYKHNSDSTPWCLPEWGNLEETACRIPQSCRGKLPNDQRAQDQD